MTIEDLIALIEAVGNSYPALFLVAGVRIFVLLWKFGKELVGLIREDIAKTEEVRKQFKNNGGSTARDQTDRIEKTLNDHLEQVAPMDAWVARKMAEEAREPQEGTQRLP